jgi:heat shock protein HtpX
MNTMKMVLIFAVLMILFIWIGGMIGGQQGMLIAFGLATVMNFVAYWFSDKMVLATYRARQIAETDNPRLFRIVRSVATKAMIPVPKVYIVPTKGPNAFATGRNTEHAAVAVTEGLLELLNDDELEGVIAHEVAHIQNYDMLIGTVAATIAGAIGILSSMAKWGAIFGGYGGREGERGGGNMISLLVAAIVAPLVAMILQMAISRQREYKADETAGRITGKYFGLASALEKIHRAPLQLNLDDRPATANLMIANPLSGKGLTNLFSTHPPVEKRIERLKELAMNPASQSYVR